MIHTREGVRRAGRRLLTGLVLALALGVAVVAGAPLAQAHAYLDGSNPSDGAVLASAPAELSLLFSEDVVPSATSITLTESTGRVRLGPVRLVTPSDPSQPTTVVVPLPSLGKGAYQVSWSTVSSDDLHATDGSFGFGVGTSVAPVGWSETSPGLVEALLRALVFAGLALGAAAPVASLLLARRSRVGPAADRLVARVTVLVAVTAALAGVALLGWELLASPAAASSVLHSRYAVWWSAREVGLLAVVASAAASRGLVHRLAARRRTGLAVVGVAVAVWSNALLGHSGSGATGSPVRAALSSVHVLSTGTWMGTLVLLTLVIVRVRPGRDEARRLLVAFGAVAGPAVGLMVVTGLALASGVVGSADALLLTDYGRLLALKVLVVAALLVVGLLNHLRLRRSGRLPGRLLVAEVSGGAVVLLLTGLVTSGQPALERQLTLDPRAPASSLVTQKVGELQEELTIRPNLPGQNVAVLRVADSRRPSPGPVSGVTFTVVDHTGIVATVPGTRGDTGRWSATLILRDWGPVTIRPVVQRQGARAVSGDLDWVVAAPAATPGPLVSRAPVSTPLVVAAWLLAAGVALMLLLQLRVVENRWRSSRVRAGAKRPASARGPGARRPPPVDPSRPSHSMVVPDVDGPREHREAVGAGREG
ncbi:MAG: copper resistance protein CopC/CopD [Actinomycetota bacterium]|nr:copper resistance protein CopC/CopD [Actinomycetota bacterium]